MEDDDVFTLDLESGSAEYSPKKLATTRTVEEHGRHLEERGEGWRIDVDSRMVPMKKEATEEGKDLSRSRRKQVRKFYMRQNELIDEFVSIDRSLRGVPDDEASVREREELEARRQRGVKIAIYGSFVLNIVLFIAKIVAVVLSGSISLIASAVDSGLDLMSGSIIFVTSCLMKRQRSPYLYPAGNTRIEPIGVLIFATAMFVATLQIIVEAIRKIVDLSAGQGALQLDILSISIVSATIGIKFLMWLYCIMYRKKSSSVRALATDHISDVISNCFLMACYLIAVYLWAYADPVGGILVSFFLMWNWYGEGIVEVRKLAGQSADPEFLQKITFLAFNHSPMVVSVDTVRAFHLANGFLVEVDIVLPFDMKLRDAHDIGESLQHRLEAVEDVERAYVHLDFEVEHAPRSEHPAQNPETASESETENEAAALMFVPKLETQFEQNSTPLTRQ